MRKGGLIAAFVACAVLFAAFPAQAEIRLEGVRWLASQGLTPARRFEEITVAPLYRGFLKGRVRARVKVRNASPGSAEGILLRYAMSARLLPMGAPASAAERAAWAVPFLVEEKRIPRIGAQQTIEANLELTTLLKLYAARLKRAGYRALELKLQVMVEPHLGEKGDIQLVESVIRVTE
ncbi:MAG: hypothetical protein HZB91_12995 [Elusimicrobia bacterium]|nr:hypothetical protein [Elusimicrobiota bacterium]